MNFVIKKKKKTTVKQRDFIKMIGQNIQEQLRNPKLW